MSGLVTECVKWNTHTEANLQVAGDVEFHDFDCDCASVIYTFIHFPEPSLTLGAFIGRCHEYILSDDHRSGKGALVVTHLAQTI